MSESATLKRFEISDELISQFREKQEIPVHFYNQNGQILIYKKEDISEREIDALLRFVKQGIYYNEADAERLGIQQRDIPDGLSDTVVVNEDMVMNLARDTVDIYENIKYASVTSLHMKKMRSRVDDMFEAFESQPDAMIGLIDILDVMKNVPQHDVEIAVKRTVVSMAMKTRGMQAQSYKDRDRLREMSQVLMMSALLCDIGFIKMDIPRGKSADLKKLQYIRQHPVISYLMLCHLPLNPLIKRNILCQHRPLRPGSPGNNFPKLDWMIDQLARRVELWAPDPGKERVVVDMLKMVDLLKREMPYDEDANILALASEFASLTTAVPWREPVLPELAVKMIINNSFFTYTDRIIREFLDYVAVSLCDNQRILNDGDFIVTAVRPANNRTYFEINRINFVDRFQSQPAIQRIASATPVFEKVPRLRIADFKAIKPARVAHYDLSRDSSRTIAYVIDPELNPHLFARISDMAGPWP